MDPQGKRLLDHRKRALRKKTQKQKKDEDHASRHAVRQHSGGRVGWRDGRLHEQGDDHFEVKIDGEDDGEDGQDSRGLRYDPDPFLTPISFNKSL